jgi:D-xylonolactonase
MKPEMIVDCRCVTGENPLWHPAERRVYWVDIPASELHRFDPASGVHEVFDTGKPAGGFTIQPDGALLLFMADGAVRLWREGAMRTVIEDIPEERGTRFNDVIADPEGRVFGGTMSSPRRAGRLYRLDLDRKTTVVLEGIGTPNGMGYTPDLKRMYQTDTGRREIYLFDYDRATGGIANRRVFARTEGGDQGGPDGLTVDAEGCVWSARWGGSRLVRYDPAGKLMAEWFFPAVCVSSVTFGGPDCTDLYVTTAAGDQRPAKGELAGALFRLNVGVRGVPEFVSRIAC